MSFVEGQAHNSNQAAHMDLYLKHKGILMVATQVRKKHWNLKVSLQAVNYPVFSLFN